MKKWIICFVMLIGVIFSNAQIVTNYSGNPATSSDGSYQFNVCKLELYEDKVYVQCVITALKPIRRLNIYSNAGRLIYGREEKGEGLALRGVLSNGEIKYLSSNSNLGWDKIGRGEKVYYTLCFGGGGNYGDTILSGLTKISIYGIGVDADGNKTDWKYTNARINNPRKHYTNYSNEYSIKQYLDANNDGICGIYEEMGDESNYKLACIKQSGEYVLVYLSSSLDYDWWKVGDIKAYLHKSASGIFKADWFMASKSINKDCYITFDGVSMTVHLASGSDSGETKYLKMYPTDPPSYNNNNQREYSPQRQQQAPQRKQTIPVLKKQNVKK